MSISTDLQKIEELLSRSVDTIYPSKEELKKKLLSGEQLRVYAGWDATGPSVHLGHAINYGILKKFHELGHKVIVLVGDFTAMIGDPTDKSSTRVRLTKEEVEENLKMFKSQVSKILDFSSKENPIELSFNSEWLSKLTFEDVVELASNFTVQQMIERETFQKRIKEEKPLYVHEFAYPLMQGYDSVALDVDVEIGGTDQTFNMLAGRTLLKRYKGKEKFVLTHPLLENPETGEILMSKSKGTGIMLTDSAQEMFVKVMMLPDPGIPLMYEHCTDLALSEIESINARLKEGENPRDIKMELASTIVRMYHGEDSVDDAKESFIKAYQEGSMPLEVPEVEIEEGELLSDALLKAEVVSSKSDFRRLVDSQSITVVPSRVIVSSYDEAVRENLDLKVGKKRFIRIKIKFKKK